MSAARKLQPTPFSIYCDQADITPAGLMYGGTLGKPENIDSDIRADSPIDGVNPATTPRREPSITDVDEYYTSPVRHVSNFTATSVSSLPSSCLASENEGQYSPIEAPRPSLHSAGVRRSYKSYKASSPRKSVNVRASPRPRTRERQEEMDTPLKPLVLLHVTLLPVALPWSRETVTMSLPESIQNSLALLRSRFSDTILRRGLLIPHPQDDFQGLEERVLEALDLDHCDSGPCESWAVDEKLTSNDSDDGLQGCCHICGDVNCFSRELERKWEVRVYAANGLLRMGAWNACWSEMERVDVEIAPYIPHHVRRKLDEIQSKCDCQEEQRSSEAVRQTSFDEQPREASDRLEETTATLLAANPFPEAGLGPAQGRPAEASKQRAYRKVDQSLPVVYKPKDVPLRVLLGNYIYLLAQDRRNIAIVFLLGTLVFSTIQGLGAQEAAAATDTHAGLGDMERSQMPPQLGQSHISWSLTRDRTATLTSTTNETPSL
ncbi:hypothetical protein BDV97DRAFT_95710 [Delphinella strobiligena]|nr:hypothetical protein BDV97DRAFT_95710 [Delphinella strobiligena]